jgi:hypothetical protein
LTYFTYIISTSCNLYVLTFSLLTLCRWECPIFCRHSGACEFRWLPEA